MFELLLSVSKTTKSHPLADLFYRIDCNETIGSFITTCSVVTTPTSAPISSPPQCGALVGEGLLGAPSRNPAAREASRALHEAAQGGRAPKARRRPSGAAQRRATKALERSPRRERGALGVRRRVGVETPHGSTLR